LLALRLRREGFAISNESMTQLRHRTHEADRPIDTTGPLTSTHDGFEDAASRDENGLAAARWTTLCGIERDQSSSS
jgi:hypothetical protein